MVSNFPRLYYKRLTAKVWNRKVEFDYYLKGYFEYFISLPLCFLNLCHNVRYIKAVCLVHFLSPKILKLCPNYLISSVYYSKLGISKIFCKNPENKYIIFSIFVATTWLFSWRKSAIENMYMNDCGYASNKTFCKNKNWVVVCQHLL